MSRQLFSCLSFITMSGLLAFISRSVCIGISHKIVMLSLSVTVWGSCSYHFSSTFIFSSLFFSFIIIIIIIIIIITIIINSIYHTSK